MSVVHPIPCFFFFPKMLLQWLDTKCPQRIAILINMNRR